MKITKELVEFLEIAGKHDFFVHKAEKLIYIHDGYVLYPSNKGTLFLSVESNDFTGVLNFNELKNTIKLWKKDLDKLELDTSFDSSIGKDAYYIMNGTKRIAIDRGDNHFDPTDIEIPEIPTVNSNYISNRISDYFKILPFVSDDETRPFMNGVHFSNSRTEATDGRQLYAITPKFNNDGLDCIVPVIIGIKEKSVSDIIISKDNKKAYFVCHNGIVLCYNTIDGNYPNFNNVIPDDSYLDNSIENTDDLVDSINEIVKINKLHKSKTGRVLFTKETLYTEKYKFTNDNYILPVEYDSTVAFNDVYLYKLFSVLPKGKCECTSLNTDRAMKPFYVKNGNELFVLMPMTINYND